MQASSRSTAAGVFILALSIIVFEIALTRVFAIMMWHHFTYMVISVGLLGFGAAGSILTARQDSLRRDSPAGPLCLYSLAYGVGVLLAFALATRTEIDSLRIWEHKGNLLRFGFIYTAIAVPFVFGGLAIGTALTRFARDVSRLYFFDLLGSAAGAALSVALLSRFGGTTSVVFASLGGLLAAFLFSLGADRRHRLITAPALVLGALLWAGFAGGLSPLSIGPIEWPIPWAPGKEMHDIPNPQDVHRIFSATAEVEVAPEEVRSPSMGGDLSYRSGGPIEARLVGQDGTAPTILFRNAADIERFDFLQRAQAGSAYQALRARGGTAPRVLVIGVGGGVDVMLALAHGASKVVAVELNTAMIEMVRDAYDEYLGGLFRPDAHAFSHRVELINSEGRAHLRNGHEKFDIIQLSGVDSFTALNSGAYALSESYLYTVEAVQDFYEHLEPGGYINYSRWMLTRPKKPRETLRLANIAATALRQLGVEDPASQIAVFGGTAWASTMIKRGAFTALEIASLERFARDQGFVGMIFDPLRAVAEPLRTAPQIAQLQRFALRANLASLLPDATDDHAEQLVDALVSALASFLEDDPLGYQRGLDDVLSIEPDVGPRIRDWAAKTFTDFRETLRETMGFVAQTRTDFEILLRGDAARREAFVDRYEYDLTASTDDAPFFFNYYRWSGLFRDTEQTEGAAEIYTPDFPVGHMVLLASMVQIVVLAFCLILLPLRRLARAGVRTPNSWRYFGYFSALGMGFMFIEIPMMQKMVIFLGHPTYALSVVLASILGFAGLGSLTSGRVDVFRPRNFYVLGAAIITLILTSALITRFALPHLLGYALHTRIAITILILAPPAFALGMPFPWGIRLLERRCPELLPWGWAVNGFLSVFSSIFCVVLSMAIGFTWVFALAAAIYGAGFAAIRSEITGGAATLR